MEESWSSKEVLSPVQHLEVQWGLFEFSNTSGLDKRRQTMILKLYYRKIGEKKELEN